MHSVSISQVFCKFQIEGIHNWPNCNLPEVEYLTHPHRHMFHFRAVVDVSHNDRDVEFIQLKHTLSDYLKKSYYDDKLKCCNFKHRSCEMLGQELGLKFKLTSIEVSEDDENGCIIHFTAD